GERGATPIVVSEGHPALAVGGTGDVLAGLCGANLARLGPLRAGAFAAFVHGRAARAWVRAHGGADRGMFARELADAVPAALADLARAAPSHGADSGLLEPPLGAGIHSRRHDA